jgi:hypothetical protein
MKRLLPLLTLLLLAGCATTPKDEPTIPFTQEQSAALYKKARPPQVFGLTVYNSENGPFFAGASRLHPGQQTERPFMGKKDSLAPVVGLNGRGEEGMPALLDTTAKDNWLTARAALQLGVVMLSGPGPYVSQPQHVYDEIGGLAGLAQQVSLENLLAENVVFHVRAATGPLGPLGRWASEPAPEVVLGTAFLRAFSSVQVDYPQRTLRFSATTRYPTPAPDRLVAALPLKDVQGALAVEGALDGDPITILLDVAGDFELVMNEPPEAAIRRLSLGDLVFPPGVNVVSSMDQGLGDTTYPRIGRRLLSRFVVTFDFRGKLVYFERPTVGKSDP